MNIIDVSSHNGNIAWDIAKNEIDGAIIRMGYRGYGRSGSIVMDKRFIYNWQECKRLGIPHEFYYFPTEITDLECMEAAVWIIKTLDEYKDIPVTIWLDSEYSTATMSGRSDKLDCEHRSCMLISIKGFIQSVRPEWTVGVYASNGWLKVKLNVMTLIEYNIPLWVARWGDKAPDYPCKWWQYTDKARLECAAGRLDMSREGIDA